jgi:Tfp pilus assembly protein PilF
MISVMSRDRYCGGTVCCGIRFFFEKPGVGMVKFSVDKRSVWLVALTCLHASAFARASCQEPVGRFASIEGQVQIRVGEQSAWHAAKLADGLCKGDTIRVGELSRAALVLINEAVMRLDQNTTMRLVDISGKKEQRSLIEVLKGAAQSFIRKPRLLSVNTPYLNGSIEGTEFQVSVDENRASILVLEGRILASNSQGNVAVKPGEIAESRAGAAPTSRILVNPRDAVQWALYYPPITAAPAGQGDAAASLDTLNKVAESGRDTNFYLQRAALLLDVGRQDEARADIDAALRRDPKSGQAHALRAIIHVVRNEREPALSDGGQAVALSDTAATRIALSYAQQADFRIEAARDTLLVAVKNHPDNALAWARLSELWLMLGDKPQSREAAAKAAALAPNLERTHLVQGFADLAAYRDAEARTSFQRAIELSPSDPLAHLGLGLAQISDGQLEAGRGELEVAVALDANQALLRAYLGKAYFEERRSPLDNQQFEIAKQLDPNDPTAYLYDGISKQSENRPVEALADLEQSIILNDGRAVYRSRLLLDKDRAARGTSLARVYNDLGFAELGLKEATDSLAVDPANASAHRFLSDSYQNVRRREIARVSELLQAQMLQDVNLSPIQPSTSEANLNIATAGGPASAGFNEFTPLFQRNQTQFNLAGLAGNHDTTGLEAALTGVYDRFSFGLSALTYNTDGWRPNNGLEQDVYNIFVQAALTDQLNIQAEFRHRESTEGDLAFNFDPDDFLDDKTIKREQDTTRLGLRYSPSAQSHFLLSYIHGRRNEGQQIVTPGIPDFILGIPGETITFTDNVQADEKANQVEAQFIQNLGTLNYVVGAAWSKSDRENAQVITMDHSAVGDLGVLANSQDDFSIEDPRAYAYVYLRSGATLTWTLGASYDRFEQDTYKETSFNPKLGVQWDISPDLQLRAAAFQAVKPGLVSNRSLEPTQIAGFNQLFDDQNGTQTSRYGVGLDWRAHSNLKTGVEFTQRDMEEPQFDFFAGSWITEERKEQWHRLYLDWTPSARLALHSELVYDRYSSESGVATEAGLPEKSVTWSLPLGLSYFDPSGLFAGLGVTYVDQSVQRSAIAFQASGEDSFVLMDASIGYRFPQRRGVLSLAVKNLFDTEFMYQDDSYREFRDEPSTGPYFPDRTIMGRFTLSF